MDLLKLIANRIVVPYVYSYPTTRAYEPVEDFDNSKVIFAKDINLYIHIPFCNQKCSFCGYLTIVSKKMDDYEEYVEALVKEISYFRYSKDSTVKSINFGGGTPMLLSIHQMERIIKQIKISFPYAFKTATEISIEATPDSICSEKVTYLQEDGFNRISIGVQTLNNSELIATKRKNLSQSTHQAIETIKKSGIKNLCCDLMYGLPNQTKASWEKTLTELIDYRPETIELYRTVVIPGTGLAGSNSNALSDESKYQIYEEAREKLFLAGYMQDSHLRFVLPQQGFYEQQVNVFKGQSLLGFGVGARSYAKNIHYRNSYGFKDSKLAIKRYIKNQNDNVSSVESAIFISNDEEMRRHIIYNLEALDIRYIQQKYNYNLLEKNEEFWKILEGNNFIKFQNNFISLKEKASYFRDLLAYYFFSESIKNLESTYYQRLIKI